MKFDHSIIPPLLLLDPWAVIWIYNQFVPWYQLGNVQGNLSQQTGRLTSQQAAKGDLSS